MARNSHIARARRSVHLGAPPRDGAGVLHACVEVKRPNKQRHGRAVVQAQEVHAAIRTALAGLGVPQVRVLYGGSVKPDNAAKLFAMADIDGALVGGASLVADDFWRIVAA